MTTWSLTWSPQDRREDIALLLADGWEPFGVIGPSGPSGSIQPVLYFRKMQPVQAQLQAGTH